MKKILAIVLVLALLLPSLALADVDLSGMSYDELVALKEKINLALWNSSEWQEVKVPAGVYTVGIDIPEGKWTIKSAKDVVWVSWGDLLDESGVGIDINGDIFEVQNLYNPSYALFEEDIDRTEVTYDIKNGQFIIIEMSSAIFTPYSGGKDLGFK